MSDFDRNGFQSFINSLDFLTPKGNEGIQELLQFLCLHGVKENEFASILALYLQKYSKEGSYKFTTIVNSSLPKYNGMLIRSLLPYALSTTSNSDQEIVEKVVGVTDAGFFGRSPVSDIQIYNLDQSCEHVIELKTNRRQKYLEELADYFEDGNYPESGCLQKLVSDLKALASFQAFSIYEEVVFWQGVLTYSFYETGSPFPAEFPKYTKNESKANNTARRMPTISKDEVIDEWFKQCEREIEQLKNQLQTFLGKQDYLEEPKEIHTVQVAQGIVNLHESEDGSGARVLVKSELLIFEVIAREKYLQRIAPQICEVYETALKLDNKKEHSKKQRST